MEERAPLSVAHLLQNAPLAGRLDEGSRRAVAFTITKSQVIMSPTTRSSCQEEMSMPLSPAVGTALRDHDVLVAPAECRHDR